MCGIFGVYCKQGADRLLVKKATQTLAHRGPDGSGIYVDGPIGLGHRRLSILDLSTRGKQPMTTVDEDFVITYNGELYNYKYIKEDLIKKGCIFKSETDTEVVLNAYKIYGPSCLQQFDGIFAFAIYHVSKKTLFIARDPLGVKPLYYSLQGTT